jgi:Flp pilus assembly protein TadD
MYTFLGLRAKQMGVSYATPYQIAQRELALMQARAKRPPAVPRLGKAKTRKKDKGEVKLTNRFLKGHAEFISGMAAMQAGNFKEAAKKLKKATEQVPEDAVAWMQLSRAFTQEGDAEDAAKATQKARKVNPCL